MRVLNLSIFILGEFGFLLTTIALIFLKLIFIQNCFPTSFILLVNSESSFSFPANNAVTAVSSEYLRLLYNGPPLIRPPLQQALSWPYKAGGLC